MRKLWRRFVQWLKREKVAPDKIGYGTTHREVCDVSNRPALQSMRDELCDMIFDRQISRAKAFGQQHRANRSK